MDSAAGNAEFALDRIMDYNRKFDEFGTPLLKRKSLEPADAGSFTQDAALSHSASRSQRSETTSTTTNRTTTSNVNSMRSPLSTFKLMSQTIAEYGDMIAQRRTEIAELQRANQLRITSSGYPKVHPDYYFAYDSFM